MSDLKYVMQAQMTQLQDQIALYEQLLAQVVSTCGQHNCNCPGSQNIKQLARQLSGGTLVTTGRR